MASDDDIRGMELWLQFKEGKLSVTRLSRDDAMALAQAIEGQLDLIPTISMSGHDDKAVRAHLYSEVLTAAFKLMDCGYPDVVSYIQTVVEEHGDDIKAVADDDTKKEGMCFVATAACGSAMAPDVVALRHFRDTVLRTSRAGRGFIVCYERLSPPLARLIARSPLLARLARALIVRPAHWLAERGLR